MKKLSKKESIIECQRMWNWLAENPDKRKVDYFKSIKKLNSYSNEIPVNECYACSYTSSPKEFMVCSKCYMLGLWIPTAPITAPCLQSSSPYKLWIESKEPSERSKYAKKIAKHCTLLLRKEKK